MVGGKPLRLSCFARRRLHQDFDFLKARIFSLTWKHIRAIPANIPAINAAPVMMTISKSLMVLSSQVILSGFLVKSRGLDASLNLFDQSVKIIN